MYCCTWSRTVALKYCKVERFIHWLIKKNAEVLEVDDPGGGAFAGHSLVPTPQHLDRLYEFAHFFKKIASAGGGGGGGEG